MLHPVDAFNCLLCGEVVNFEDAHNHFFVHHPQVFVFGPPVVLDEEQDDGFGLADLFEEEEEEDDEDLFLDDEDDLVLEEEEDDDSFGLTDLFSEDHVATPLSAAPDAIFM